MEVSIFSRPTRRAVFQVFKGYSYESSQYGLTVDNVAGYELVLPNGTIVNVSQEDQDLWFGLRVSRQDQYKWCVSEGF